MPKTPESLPSIHWQASPNEKPDQDFAHATRLDPAKKRLAAEHDPAKRELLSKQLSQENASMIADMADFFAHGQYTPIRSINAELAKKHTSHTAGAAPQMVADPLAAIIQCIGDDFDGVREGMMVVTVQERAYEVPITMDNLWRLSSLLGTAKMIVEEASTTEAAIHGLNHHLALGLRSRFHSHPVPPSKGG